VQPTPQEKINACYYEPSQKPVEETYGLGLNCILNLYLYTNGIHTQPENINDCRYLWLLKMLRVRKTWLNAHPKQNIFAAPSKALRLYGSGRKEYG
jgi:glycyl-tRNA synthetase alpha subunit